MENLLLMDEKKLSANGESLEDADSSVLAEVRQVLADALVLGERGNDLAAGSPLLGHLPELDSQAVVHVILTLEEHFGIEVDDDEISADTFATLGTLADFVASKSG